ncbi:MAG TPA: tetratricopeptide repeat protein, partial [Chloroflexota bacterium]|nr:tetratricopeptide repeat protein [Chloroflexota bacterium]
MPVAARVVSAVRGVTAVICASLRAGPRVGQRHPCDTCQSVAPRHCSSIGYTRAARSDARNGGRAGRQLRHPAQAAAGGCWAYARRARRTRRRHSRGVSALERGHRRRPYPHTVRALTAALGLDSAQCDALLATARGQPPRQDATRDIQRRALPGSQLPTWLTNFVGRQRELKELIDLLETTRLVTLVGPGGVGKTRLAVAVAHRARPSFANVWFLQLTDVTDPELVPKAVARATGVFEQPATPMIDTLVAAISSKHVLLVLDNCEHLAETCARLAETLLLACPRLTILATSRQLLGCLGEQVHLLGGLEVPEMLAEASSDVGECSAVQLFLERMAARCRFALADQRHAVVHICRRLDGVPLALELAAARACALGLDETVRRLDRALDFAALSGSTVPSRHGSLRAAVDWSYALLGEREQLLFDRLAAFAGGWSLEAAETVTSCEPFAEQDVANLLAALVDKSLVLAEPAPLGGMRYRMLEPLRLCAAERIEARQGLEALAERHAGYFLALAEQAALGMLGPDGRYWLDMLESEQSNFRSALKWASANAHQVELRLVRALAVFWTERGHWHEGMTWLRDALQRTADDDPTPARAHALRHAAIIAVHQNDFAAAQTWLEEAVQIARALRISGPIGGLGFLRAWHGELASAKNLLEEDLALAQQTSDAHFESWALRGLGGVTLAEGDVRAARECFERAVRLLRELGDDWGLAMALQGIGDAARALAEYPRALALYEESLRCLVRRGSNDGIRSLLQNLASVARHDGHLARAADLLSESLALYLDQGEKRGQAECLSGLGGVALALNDPLAAARLLGAVEALVQEIDADLS